MEWRQAPDDYGRQLARAGEALLANVTNPWNAVEHFEPILEGIKYNLATRAEKLPRIRSLGCELFLDLRAMNGAVATEVRHYCWYLQHLDELSENYVSIIDLFMLTLTRFAHFEGHRPDHCSICPQFPEDFPFQGSPDGREHFSEWMTRKKRVSGNR